MSIDVCSIGNYAPPICLADENPNRLVSLLDMLRFNAHHWVASASTLGQAIMDMGSDRIPAQESMKMVIETCGLLLRDSEALDLKLSAAHIRRFRNEILRAGVTYSEIRASLIEIQRRIWDELESRKLFALSLDDDKYFDGQFPQSVIDRFPQIAFDADEAGKCLALERPTSCVYHLMRVTEYGLHRIGKTLGIKDERPNWEPIITKIDSELKKPFKERQHKGMADFLANVSAHLNAVKVAWRNRVMHVDRKHTQQEAREIYNATCGLMRYIAENLPEEKGIVTSIREMIKR